MTGGNATNRAARSRPAAPAKPATPQAGGRPSAFRCPACKTRTAKLFRVRATADGPWQIACPTCCARLAHGAEGYTYGGAVGARAGGIKRGA